jgi:molybdenum cofactor biosynthesis enzyme MoaA
VITDLHNIKLSEGLTYTLKSMPRGNKHSEPIAHRCNLPFTQVNIDSNFDCFLCNCEGYLPVPVGKVLDFNSLTSVWESPIAKMLQQDIEEKKYTNCAVYHCGIIQGDRINQTAAMAINIDDSCNLACPSCRRELKMVERGPEYDVKIQNLNQILSWLTQYDQPIHISLGGSGDGLASPVLRPLIKNYVPKQNQTFQITTNGLLIKKLLPDASIRSAITNWSISVDAGSSQVYEQVRRPGKWKNLLENLEWLANNKESSKIRLNFVVQKNNFRDIPAFTGLCQQFQFLGTLQALNDWGTWNSKPVKNPDVYTIQNGTFMDHNVADPSHPEHQDFLEVLQTTRVENILHISPYFNKFK